MWVWRSVADYAANRKPLLTYRYQIGPTATDALPSFATLLAQNATGIAALQANVYALLATLPEFAGALPA